MATSTKTAIQLKAKQASRQRLFTQMQESYLSYLQRQSKKLKDIAHRVRLLRAS